MAGSLGFAEQSKLYTGKIRKHLKKEIENYKSVRHLIQENFYPLFHPGSLEEYDGWQFHNPETGEGFFMVFRCHAKNDKKELFLPGLTKGISYKIVDFDTGEKKKVYGGKLFIVKINEFNGVKWFKYSCV